MRITVNESPIGELFFSLPQPEELIIAEEQIINHCRNALQQKENSRLEYELEQMKKTKTAFHFLILKEIYSLSKENGHPIFLQGNIAGSIISYLLGVSPINPDEIPFIASELIWEANKEFSLPSFEIGICADVRPLIHKRLDEKFSFVNTNNTLYYRIVMTDSPLCSEVSDTNINIKNFDTNICTAVLKEMHLKQKNNSCNFEQLINCYAYIVSSFANDIPLEDLLNDNVIVTRDKLYLSLTANNVPHELAAEIVKTGIWGGEPRKREYLLQLEKYSLPESVIFSINNAENLWNTATCVSRLCMLCQKEHELRGKKEDKYVINDSVNDGYIAEIKNDTLEIYVPDNTYADYITVGDLKEKIPKEYISGITKVIIGNRIKDISNLSFDGYNKLESVHLGADVEFVNPASFYGAFNLSEIVVSNSNKFFKVCDNVLFSYDMKTLIKYAQGKRDFFYEIPNYVELVGKYAFACAIYLNCVKVGDNVKSIGEYAFHNAWNLRHIYVGEGVTDICGRYVFSGNDELELWLCEWHLVVGGKENSKIASWCENEGVNFYALKDDEIDDFLALPLPKLKPFPFGNDKYLMHSSKIKQKDYSF